MITFELLSPGKYLPDDYWLTVAPTCRRLEVEFGPGDGRFLTESARSRADTLFVGIEIRTGWAKQIACAKALPANAKIYNADARFIVSYLLASRSVDAFHLYFPDPWWKKRHHKRRLVTAEVATEMRRALRQNGRVYLITDVEPLFEEMQSTLLAAGFTQIAWSRDPSAAAQSSYERKYRRQGRTVYETSFAPS